MKRLALLALAVTILANCSKLSVCRQEIWFRHNQVTDQLDLLLISEGVGVEEREGFNLGQRILDKERIVVLHDGPELDLDELLEDSGKTFSEQTLRTLQSIHVVSAEAYLDEEGRLSWAQHFRIPYAAGFIAAVNELVRQGIADDPPWETDDPIATAQDRRLREACEADWTFVDLRGSQLFIRLPLTDSNAWELEQELRTVQGEDFPVTIDFMDVATVLFIGDPEQEFIRVVWPDEDDDYDCSLLHALLKERRINLDLDKNRLIERFQASARSIREPTDEGRRPLQQSRR